MDAADRALGVSQYGSVDPAPLSLEPDVEKFNFIYRMRTTECLSVCELYFI